KFSFGFFLWLVNFELLQQSVEIEGVEPVGTAGLEHDGVEAGQHLGPLKADEAFGAFALVGIVNHSLFFGFGQRDNAIGFGDFLSAVGIHLSGQPSDVIGTFHEFDGEIGFALLFDFFESAQSLSKFGFFDFLLLRLLLDVAGFYAGLDGLVILRITDENVLNSQAARGEEFIEIVAGFVLFGGALFGIEEIFRVKSAHAGLEKCFGLKNDAVLLVEFA